MTRKVGALYFSITPSVCFSVRFFPAVQTETNSFLRKFERDTTDFSTYPSGILSEMKSWIFTARVSSNWTSFSLDLLPLRSRTARCGRSLVSFSPSSRRSCSKSSGKLAKDSRWQCRTLSVEFSNLQWKVLHSSSFGPANFKVGPFLSFWQKNVVIPNPFIANTFDTVFFIPASPGRMYWRALGITLHQLRTTSILAQVLVYRENNNSLFLTRKWVFIGR